MATSTRAAKRRDQLAEAALLTLSERGYANTSLRDIAENSPFSHGVLHYYFTDKIDLIVHGVRLYKAHCVTRFDSVVEESGDTGALADAFSVRLAETAVDDAPMHRLWYDLRTQAMFDQRLREPVALIDLTLEQMVWHVIERYGKLADRPPRFTPDTTYAMLDGIFEQALRAHLAGDPGATAALSQRVRDMLPALLR